MDRPVIGLCTALERAQWSVWDQPAVLLPRNYVDAVQQAGGFVTDFRGGDDFLFGGELCAACGIHSEMLSIIKTSWGY